MTLPLHCHSSPTYISFPTLPINTNFAQKQIQKTHQKKPYSHVNPKLNIPPNPKKNKIKKTKQKLSNLLSTSTTSLFPHIPPIPTTSQLRCVIILNMTSVSSRLSSLLPSLCKHLSQKSLVNENTNNASIRNIQKHYQLASKSTNSRLSPALLANPRSS